MKSRIKTGLLLNIICDVMLALAIITFIRYSVMLSGGSELMYGVSERALDNLPTDGDNPAAGFELIFGVAGGAFAGIAGLIASAISFLMLIPAVTCGIVFIVSIILLILYKKYSSLSYLIGNSVMIIVLSGFSELLLFMLMIGTFSFRSIMLFAVNPFSAALIMSAAALIILRKEKKKADSGRYFTTEK